MFFVEFAKQHPAFLYAIAAVIGCFLAISPNLILLIPAITLLAALGPKQMRTRLLLTISTVLAFWFYVQAGCLIPDLDAPAYGRACLKVQSHRLKKNHFGGSQIFKGTLQYFTQKNGTYLAKNLPITFSLPGKKETFFPKVDSIYLVDGHLGQARGGGYFLTLSKDALWEEAGCSSWKLGSWRFKAKQSLGSYIHRYYHDSQTAEFLKGIATGEFDSTRLQQAFSRFGLQHLMAISGFHFALVAGILHFLLRTVLPRKWTVLVLIFLLCSYFLFLGCTASILRAWITITLALTGQILRRQSNGLNALGIAVLCILIYDPLMCRSLGFQFSVLTTAAILFFFQPAEKFIGLFLKKRMLSELLLMPPLDQHGYIIIGFIRQGLALCLAVNSTAIPLMLLLFGKFPCMSLMYNLFFPFLVSFSLFLLILGGIADLVHHGLGTPIHWCNDHYTQLVLGLTTHMPTTIDFTFRVSHMDSTLIIGYLCFLFFLGIYLNEWMKNQQESTENFVFI